jgi:hypothetical protein
MSRGNTTGYGESVRSPEDREDGALKIMYKRWSVVERALHFFLLNPEVRTEQNHRVQEAADAVMSPVARLSQNMTVQRSNVLYRRDNEAIAKEDHRRIVSSVNTNETANNVSNTRSNTIEEIPLNAEPHKHIPGESPLDAEAYRLKVRQLHDDKKTDKDV